LYDVLKTFPGHNTMCGVTKKIWGTAHDNPRSYRSFCDSIITATKFKQNE